MKNELVGISVGIVCALFLIGTVLVPMVDDVTAETKTYTNEGMPYAAVDDDTHTITITSTTITVDGEEIDQTLFPSGFDSYTLVYADAGFIRYYTTYLTIQHCDESDNTTFQLSNSATVTISVSGSTATVTSSAVSTSKSLSDVTHYIASEGAYVMALNPCVTSESMMYGAGVSTGMSGIPTSGSIYLVWYGTTEGITANMLTYTQSTSYDSFDVSDTTVNTTAIEGNLVQVDSVVIEYEGVIDDETYTTTSTYTYFLAPSEVVYDNPDYIGDTESVLLSVIPLFTILAVLCAVTYAVMRNRD